MQVELYFDLLSSSSEVVDFWRNVKNTKNQTHNGERDCHTFGQAAPLKYPGRVLSGHELCRGGLAAERMPTCAGLIEVLQKRFKIIVNTEHIFLTKLE